MFDIDGTLVDSTGFDTELYVEAVRGVLDVEIDTDWNAYEHASDSGILDEVLRGARPDREHAELAARVQERFVALVGDYLRREPGEVREIAGAKRLVERLLELPNVRVGVATGGWEPTAKLKLTHVGIETERLGEELGYDFVAVGGGVAHPVAYADLRDTDAILSCLGLPDVAPASTARSSR